MSLPRVRYTCTYIGGNAGEVKGYFNIIVRHLYVLVIIDER